MRQRISQLGSRAVRSTGIVLAAAILVLFAPFGAQGLDVAPGQDVRFDGAEGGPFSPAARIYDLANLESSPVNWTTSRNAVWYDVTPAAGTLAGRTGDAIVITPNAAAGALAPGIYPDILTITNTTLGIATTRTVTLAVTALPFGDGFESGTILPHWVSTGTNEFRTIVRTDQGPRSGSYHLTMDDSVDGSASSRNELTATLNLSGFENLVLSFCMKEWGDENDPAPASPFVGGADYDGVAISEDGNTWYEVQSLVSGPSNYTLFTVDLDLATSNAGITDTSALQIRFNHFDNLEIPTDGFAFDDIVVSGDPVDLRIDGASFVSSGPEGGPFAPVCATYTLANLTGVALDWETSTNQPWIDVTPTSGSLMGSSSDTATVCLNVLADALTTGVHTASVVFTDTTNGTSPSRMVQLTVSDRLAVAPAGGFFPEGVQGGPITPSCTTYTVTNRGTSSFDWTTSWTQPWITVTPTSGSVAGGAGALVTVCINPNFASLTSGTHNGAVMFINQTTSFTETRDVELSLVDPLRLTPSSDFVSTGPDGGPFTPPCTTYTVTNRGASPFDWITSWTQPWITVMPTSGTVAGGGSALVTACLNANADGLTSGTYNETIRFVNQASSFTEARNVELSIVDRLLLTPSTDFVSTGPVGGPFSPPCTTYTVTNRGAVALDWATSWTQPWISVMPTSGTIAGGISEIVTVSINALADGMPFGVHNGTVTVTHTGTGSSVVRDVTLDVGPGPVIDLAQGLGALPFAQVFGDDALDRLGAGLPNGIAFGDVNGDGFDDAIVGAPFADPAGGGQAGEVYVVYGSSDLPGSTVDLNTDGAITSLNETRILGDDPGDRAGSTVASGDVNGDGYDDVIIGAPIANPPGGNSAGEVYVVYGNPGLPGSIVDLDTDGDGSAANETRILGDDSNDDTGLSVASGDVDGDGYDDILIGAPFANPPGGNGAGEVYVVYGGPNLPGSIVDLDTDGAVSAANETRILGDDSNDGAGHPVASGDVDGDGYDDVLIGAPSADPPGGSAAGEVFVVYGDPVLPGSIVDLNSDGAITTASETRILGDDAVDGAGLSLAASDVNGDGYDDVIVGAAGADPADRAYAGELYVIHGGAGITGTIVDLDVAWGGLRVLGGKDRDSLGYGGHGGGGDLDLNGFADFAASARTGDNPSIVGNPDNDSGWVLTVFGDGPATEAVVTEFFRAGDAPRRGVGRRLAPVSRTWLAFTGGTSSSATVRITRGKAPIANLGNGTLLDVAGVLWEVTTTRTGFATADLTFQYLDAEIANFNEADLTLYQAPSPSGPWTLAPTQTLDPQRNTIGATVTGLSYFAIVGDTTQPDVTVEQSPGQADPTGTLPIAFDVTFSEAVTGFDENDVAMGGTATGVTFSVAGAGSTYAITVTAVGADGTIVPTIPAGGVPDLAGNLNTASTSVDNSVTLDRLIPAVALTSTAPDSTNTSPIAVTVTFNRPMTGFDASDVLLTNAALSNFNGDGVVYTFDLIPVGQGLVSAEIPAGIAQDMLGRPNPSAQLSRTFDTVAPTALITSFAPEPTNFSFIEVMVTFSKPVSGFDALDLVVSNALLLNFAGSGMDYSFLLVPMGLGPVTVDLPAGVAQDLAGNGNTAAPQFLRTFDDAQPAVFLSSTAPDPTNAPIAVTVTFTEPVTGFDASDVLVSNATVANFAGIGATYSFDLAPVDDGLVTADVPAGVARDAAFNGNTVAPRLSRTYDGTPPTVSMSSAAADPTNVSPITITAVFSENVTGFAAVDIAVGNGSISSFSGSGDTYSFDLTPTRGGPVTADIPAGTAQDTAGNDNMAAPQLSRNYDHTPATASITRIDSSPTTASLVRFRVSFDETVTGVDQTDFVLAVTGDVTGASITSVAGSERAYTVNIDTGSGDGTIRIGIVDDDSIVDTADNPLGGPGAGNGDFTGGDLYRIDRTGPVTRATGPTDSVNQAGPVIPVTFTGSDLVAGLRGVMLYYRKHGAGTGFQPFPGEFAASPIPFDTSTTGGNGTYEFYTMGLDNLGNVEAAKQSAEITVNFNVATDAKTWIQYR